MDEYAAYNAILSPLLGEQLVIIYKQNERYRSVGDYCYSIGHEELLSLINDGKIILVPSPKKNSMSFVPVDLVSDFDGHDFLIPSHLLVEFNKWVESDYESEDFDPNKYDKYRVEGDRPQLYIEIHNEAPPAGLLPLSEDQTQGRVQVTGESLTTTVWVTEDGKLG